MRALPATVAVPPPRSPPRWLLNTLSAPVEAAVSGWLNVATTDALRGTARTLAAGVRLVMVKA